MQRMITANYQFTIVWKQIKQNMKLRWPVHKQLQQLSSA